MSDLERNLRDMLNQRADASVPPPGDWQDLTIRMARRNRRAKRLMAGALALVLLVGPIAGFAVAKAIEDPAPSGRVTAGGPGADASATEVATAQGQAFSRIAIGTDGGFGVPLEKLFRRTNDGIAVRAFVGSFNGNPSNCQGDGWCPPVDCFADGLVVGQLSTDDAVGTGTGEHFAAITGDLRLTGSGAFGANGEESPARWVTAQVSDKIAKVRVTFEGGGSDEMAPVDGVVLLAARSDVTKPGGSVEALDGSGSVKETVPVEAVGFGFGVAWEDTAVVYTDGAESSDASSGTTVTTVVGPSPAMEPSTTTATVAPDGTSISPADPGTPSVAPSLRVTPGAARAECQPPPPTLPAPGEQPENAAAAKAEVEQAFATAYAGLGDDAAKRAAVEDSESLTDVMAQANSGSFAQQVKDASATVTEVVFTSPTEAAVRYDINVANYGTNFPGRIGKAKLIDGRWKVARVTICADISLAGVSCPAG